MAKRNSRTGKRKGKGKKRAAPKKASRRVGKRRGSAKVLYCHRGSCAKRPILGGAKGMRSHVRKHHRRQAGGYVGFGRKRK